MHKPKRILALDGGGIRGALSLGFIEKIEEFVRAKEGNSNTKLCDYYDLIGGTSTGAIIAACLSLGMSASDIKDLYLNLGNKIFGKKFSWIFHPFKRYRAEFDFRPLEAALTEIFGDIKMGDSEIKTSLCIITKRADTLSTWPIISHPGGKFYENILDDEGKLISRGNKDFLLREVVRASAAAPTYFVPQKIKVDNDKTFGTFIDGGVSLANNPSLLMFLVATLKEFPFQWKTGEDVLSLHSVGTGTFTKRYEPSKIFKKGLFGWAKLLPESFMEDADYLNQTMLQYLSHSPTPRVLDSEILDLKGDLLTKEPALHYLRYNAILEKESLKELGLNFTEKQIISMREMSNSQNKESLYLVGKRASEKYVKIEHLK